jgi:phosphoribosylformylglycinamidine synthase
MGISMKARVFVSLKPTVLDPQGQTIRAALNAHGHPFVADVRQGKYFDLTLDATDRESARNEVEAIARDVLANPVIEDYRIDFID